MISKYSKAKIWAAKPVSAVLILAMIVNPMFSGAPLYAAQTPEVSSSLNAQTLKQWKLPKALGRVAYVSEETQGAASATVLLIEDAHAIPSAQESIREIIEYLQTRDGLTTVFFEGAEGPLDPLLFRTFTDKKKLRTVFNHYRDRGELSGVTLAAVLNSKEGVYQGVESEPLYEDQINAWLEADLARADQEKTLSQLQSDLLKAEQVYASDELKNLNAAERRFENDHHLEGWLKALYQTPSRAKIESLETRYPAVAVIFREMQADQTAQENAAIRKALEDLYARVTDAVKSSLSRDLSEKRQGYLTEQLSAGAWAHELISFAKKQRVSVELPETLKKMAKQHRLLEKVRGHEFFDQLESLNAQIRAELNGSDEERVLEQLRLRLKLLGKLIRLELTRKEWLELSRPVIDSTTDGELVNRAAEDVRQLYARQTQIDQALTDNTSVFVRFYTLAVEREEVFWEKMRPSFENGTVKLAAFVGGGFHTEGLRAKLQQAHVAHAVITPQMTLNAEAKSFYRAAMRGQVSWGDDFAGDVLEPYTVFSRAVAAQLSKGSEDYQLKLWQRAIQEEARQSGEVSQYLSLLRDSKNDAEIPQAFIVEWQEAVQGFIRDLKQRHFQKNISVVPTPAMTATGAFANPLVRNARYPASWRDARPAIEAAGRSEVSLATSARSEVRLKTWLETQDLPRVQNLTVISRQMEAGLHDGILKALQALPNGEVLVRQVAQTTLTGGLGALMHDLFDAWGKNGIDVIGINPIYEHIKAQKFVAGTPPEMEFGQYMRQVLDPAGIDDFEISLNLSPEFAAEAKRRNSKAVSIIERVENGKVITKTLKARIYQTKTAVAGTTLFYMDVFYLDGDKEVSIFDEVYPDEPGQKASLWRDVHIAAYNKASSGLVDRLAKQGRIKQKRLQVNNEVFVSLPTGEDRHDINHTVFLPGLYRSHELSYSLLDLPPEWRDKVVRDGVIDYTNVIPLDPKLKVITGVGLKEHTPELEKNIFPGFVDKLDGYNENDVRSTNGVLLDKWQVPLKRVLIQQFKEKLNMPKPSVGDDTEDDRVFFEVLRKNTELLEEFQRRSEYINAASVGAFLVWLKTEQKQPLWLEKTVGSQGAKDVADFIAAVRQSIENQDPAQKLDTKFETLKNALLKDPIVSNIRRQVPYKGPDKWIEVLEGFSRDGIALANFKRNGPRVVLGGRVFDDGAQGKFDRLKHLINDLGLEDQMTTIENYNNLDAEVIFQGMAGMVMLSDEFLEASATSMMKGVTNFAALIGVWGGAMPEIFEIVDIASGRVIDIFGENVTHDQVVENLAAGIWKITNGWMVSYGQEMSDQTGGERRPSAQSLVDALTGLKKAYSSEASRRILQFDVLASSYLVNMVTGQARAHAYLWERALAKDEDERAFFDALQETDADIIQLLSVNDGGYSWKTADSNVSVQSESGFIGFLKGFEELQFMERDRAKVVYKSMVYHLTHRFSGDDGDVFNYILGHLFKQALPSLEPLRARILALESQAKQAENIREKIKYNLEALSLLKRLLERRTAFLHSPEFMAQLVQRYIDGDHKMSRIFANREVLLETAQYLTETAQPSELENFFEAAVNNLIRGDHFVADIFRSETLRQRFADYLKNRTDVADALDFSSTKTPVYPILDNDRTYFVGIDLGDFSYSPQRGGEQKAWSKVRNAGLFLRTHAPEGREVSRRSQFQVRDVLTGSIYTKQDLQAIESQGLAVGIPAHFVQVLAIEAAPEERLPFLIGNAVRGQLTHGRESSVLISGELKNLIQNPTRLREVLKSLSELSPEAVQEKFTDPATSANAVGAVMALIGFFAPDLFENTRLWNEDIYQKLTAIYKKSGLNEVLEKGAAQLHVSDPDTAVVISKKFGRRRVVLPIQFSKFRFSEDDGKVWVRLNSEDAGIIDDTGVFYNVRDYTVGPAGTDYGVHSGRELSTDDWHVGIPVVPGKLDRKNIQQHGWQFQILELEQLQRVRDDHHRRIDELVGDNLEIPHQATQKFFINLTDLGAAQENGALVFKNGLQKAEALLDTLVDLGVGEVYLGGGLYPVSDISVDLHQVPNAQEHFISKGRSVVRVVNYTTNRVENGELVLAHNQGNPFSIGGSKGMLEINPKLAVGEDARQALKRFAARAQELGIRVRVDFVAWRSPDSIDETNYEQTFYRELTESERASYAAKQTDAERERYLQSIIASDGTIFYTRVPIGGEEKIIFVKHVWGYGAANADQAMVNSLAPQTQDYLIEALKARIDDGVSSLRVDLAFQLLKSHLGRYLNGLSHETVQRWSHEIQTAEEPLTRIIREVRAYAASQGKTVLLNAEAYDEGDRVALLALGFDSTYYGNLFDDYAGLVFDHKPAYHLIGSAAHALKSLGQSTIYGSNFDQTSLRRIGGPRKGFTMLLNLLAYLGVDVLWTLRDALGHYGDLAPIPGGVSKGRTDRHFHEFVTLRELQVRTNPERLAEELTQGPLARSLAEITNFLPAPKSLDSRQPEDVQILDNQNTQQFVSLAYRNADNSWTIFVYNTQPDKEAQVWLQQPAKQTGESYRGYAASDVFDGETAARIDNLSNRLEGIRFEIGEQYRVFKLGPTQRSEVRAATIRQNLQQAVQPYVEDLSQGDDFISQKPNVFLLLGNPNLKVFLEFARAWKTQYAGTPIVLAGGRGRGTVPLIEATLAHYGESLNTSDRETLNRGLNDVTVKETDVLQIILKTEGVDGPVTVETQPSSNTAQNFQYSAPALQAVLSDKTNPIVAVVSAPWLLKRVQATATNEFARLGFPQWQAQRFAAFQPDLNTMTDQELADFVSYIAGHPDVYVEQYPALGRWNERSELNGFYGVQGVPVENRDLSSVKRVQDAFETFLTANNAVYSAQFNKLELQRSEVRLTVQHSLFELARGRGVATETLEFLSALPFESFAAVIEQVELESQRPAVIRAAYENFLSSPTAQAEASFAANNPEFESLSDIFLTDSIQAVRDSAHDALLSDSSHDLHFAIAFPLRMEKRIAEGLLEFSKMLQGLGAEYPSRVKASLLLLADSSDLEKPEHQAYLKALRRTGVAKIVTSDNPQLPVEMERFLRDNPNALVWGEFEDVLRSNRRIHLVHNRSVTLKTALPFAFLLSRKLAEARYLTADLLKRVPENMQGGAITFNGSSLEVTRFAAALVARMKARQLLDIAA